MCAFVSRHVSLVVMVSVFEQAAIFTVRESRDG